jgi:hypothetical protein
MEQYLPDTFGGMTGAFNAGRLLAGQRKAAADKQQLSTLAPGVLAGDPTATAQAYAIDPATAKQYGEGAERMGLQLHNIANQLKQFHAQGNEAAAAMLYQQAAPMIRQKFPNAPDQWNADALMPAIDAVVAMTSQGNEQQRNLAVSPGSAIVDPTTGKVVYERPFAPEKPQNATFEVDKDGRGWWLAPGQAPVPADMPGQSPQASAPQGGGGMVLDDALANAVMQQESGGNPNAVSSAGAQGLMQLMPDTARAPGFGIQPVQDGSPQENVRVGRDYLQAMLRRYNGDQQLALAAYNAGPGRVDQAMQQAGGDKQRAMSLLPRETQQYPGAVQSRLAGGGGGGQGGLRFRVPGQTQQNQVRTLTPDEVKSAGLRPGTVAQVDSEGKVQVIQTPPAEAASGRLSATQLRQANAAKAKLIDLQAVKNQLALVQDKFQPLQNSFSAGPFGGGMLPTEDGKRYDAAVSLLQQFVRKLTRTPGEGSMSDWEGKLAMLANPSRNDYESVTQDKIDQLSTLVDQITQGYESLLQDNQGEASGAARRQARSRMATASRAATRPIRTTGRR